MPRTLIVAMTALLFVENAVADQALLKKHCAKCHSGDGPEGDFRISNLGDSVNSGNLGQWIGSLDYVESGEMPPADESDLTSSDRLKIVDFLKSQIRAFDPNALPAEYIASRRLNNRELAKSVADVLLIEDVGTHEPMAMLLGDTLDEGFDTNGDILGISEYHLEQYLNAFRKIVDATILEGERPTTRTLQVTSRDLRLQDRSNRNRNERANRTKDSIEILDLRKHVFFSNFETVPVSGRYKLKIRAMGVDRNVYRSEWTGFYQDDPIRIRVHLGERHRDFDLPDNKMTELEIDEWLAAGTRIEITYLTDALRLLGNGNFKFQYRLAHDYIKENNPKLYEYVVKEKIPKSKRAKAPNHWSHWTDYWQGPRPRLFGATIEGPLYESWPPKRHQALIGQSPNLDDAEQLLQPIAERAWRRKLHHGELDAIVDLVKSRAPQIGKLPAIKEGIVAILVSPSFLMINPEEGTPTDRFATKLSYFLNSTIPDQQLRSRVAQGELNSFDAVLEELNRQLEQGELDEFLREFPYAWMELDRINFMSPDPDIYPMYERKTLSEDMINEVLFFFRHAMNQNVSVPEMLTADYSFLNADLAKVYGIEGVPEDSQFRKFTFVDGKRGGLLGMGAFLTLTADSLGTSPIHRAVYVMENFLGIHPSPPPGDVEINEPDVRQAKTIKEILKAHAADPSCSSCHQNIDPYGYAFENYDPVGAWRDRYSSALQSSGKSSRRNVKPDGTPVDSSAKFRNGTSYENIVEFRQLMKSDANRDRFIRCFIKKLLHYANGEEPKDFAGVEAIVEVSAKHDYRILETIAATIDSSLFRNR